MYNDYYGFSDKPFEVTPDPKFLYLTASHREALKAMKEGIRNHRNFIAISGEVGTGKTTLIHSLLAGLDEQVKTAYIFHTLIGFEELLAAILKDLGLEVTETGRLALLRQLTAYVTQLDSDMTVAVIIDEAHLLSTEVLEELGKLSAPEGVPSARLHFVFVGQPELDELLAAPPLKALGERIGVRHTIRTLTKKESRDYIEHRLKLVGSSSAAVFTPRAIAAITAHAKGIPRVINILCDSALLTGFGQSSEKVDAKIVRRVIKDMEIPAPRKPLSAIVAERIGKLGEVRLARFIPSRRAFLFLLGLLCLGGIAALTYGFLLHGSLPRLTHLDLESRWSPPSRSESSPAVAQRMPVPAAPPSAAPQSTPPAPAELPVASPGRDVPRESPAALSLPFDSAKIPKKAVVVQKGQTISRLAMDYYGMSNITLVDLILEANPAITNPDLIEVGQKIVIPIVTGETLIRQSPDRTYTIHVGTFWSPAFARLYRNQQPLRGKEIEIQTRHVTPGETWYRIFVGKFDRPDEVLRVVFHLRERGLLPLFGGEPRLK